MKDLSKAISDVKDFKPKEYQSNKENFANKIKEYINNI